MPTFETTLPIENWDEQTVRDLDEGKLARAEVTLGAGPDGLGPGTMLSVLHYAEDGTSHFVSLTYVEGTIDGRSGTITLLGEGTYDGTTASGRSRVVAGTGALADLQGTETSESTQADYPNMPFRLDYELT